jgi:glycosyltransferase involved in cell wall biosynthesis
MRAVLRRHDLAFQPRYLAARTTAGEDVPVHVVHCGVDPSLYEFSAPTVPAEGRAGAVRREPAGVQGGMRGHEVLLRAVAARPALARLELELVGDGKLRPTLERLARQLAIADRVLSRAAWTSSRCANACGARRRLRAGEHRRGRRADGGSSRRADGGDGVRGPGRQHARLSGIPELTVDGETGLLAEPSDVDGLADALERLLAEPDAARHMAIRGRALVERDFDVRESGAQTAILFRGPAAPVQAHVNAT